MQKIEAPFTEEQVKALLFYQLEGMHPFTCCSHDNCRRHTREDEGMLIPSTIGWTCPCGKYKQYWAWAYMARVATKDSKEL